MSSTVFNWSSVAKSHINSTYKSVEQVNGVSKSSGSDFSLLKGYRKDNGREEVLSFGKSISNPRDIKSWVNEAMVSELTDEDSGEVVLIIHLRGERNTTDVTDMFA